MPLPRLHDTVEMTGLMDDPDPIPVGTRGRVNYLYDGGGNREYAQIGVDWDNGRTLMLLPHDPFRVVRDAPTGTHHLIPVAGVMTCRYCGKTGVTTDALCPDYAKAL